MQRSHLVVSSAKPNTQLHYPFLNIGRVLKKTARAVLGETVQRSRFSLQKRHNTTSGNLNRSSSIIRRVKVDLLRDVRARIIFYQWTQPHSASVLHLNVLFMVSCHVALSCSDVMNDQLQDETLITRNSLSGNRGDKSLSTVFMNRWTDIHYSDCST